MLRHAFFENFKSDDTLLFWGSGHDVVELITLLRRFAAAPVTMEMPNAADGTTVVLRHDRPLGMRAISRAEKIFHWNLDADQADLFADLLEGLVHDTRPGHHWLDCNTRGEITVMVARDEYPADLAERG